MTRKKKGFGSFSLLSHFVCLVMHSRRRKDEVAFYMSRFFHMVHFQKIAASWISLRSKRRGKWVYRQRAHFHPFLSGSRLDDLDLRRSIEKEMFQHSSCDKSDRSVKWKTAQMQIYLAARPTNSWHGEKITLNPVTIFIVITYTCSRWKTNDTLQLSLKRFSDRNDWAINLTFNEAGKSSI